ncbi:hypothetical protein F4824DRAFT_349203 [Ustulina deusta]|nr:hypothetical protein F4824DRAFT_349203 [Ustulina deusta]
MESYRQSEILDLKPDDQIFSQALFLPDSHFLNAKCVRFFDMNTSKFAFVLAHPVAERMELHHCAWDIVTKIPHDNGTAAVRVMLLESTRINFIGFEQLLESLPRLHTLIYFRPYDERDTDFDWVGKALCQFGGNLENLTMLNNSLMPFCSEIGPLASLSNLKTLEIELEFLVGFRDIPHGGYYEYMDFAFESDEELDYDEIHESFGDWSFLTLLPPTLEKLVISIESPKLGVYFNTYERYGAKFEELLSADGQFENLEHVEAPYIHEVAARVRDRLTSWILQGTDTMKRVAVIDSSDESMTDTEEEDA